MHVRLTALAAALFVCTTPAWAATSNVDVYGVFGINVDSVSSTYGTYSTASNIGANFFSDPAFVLQSSVTNIPGATASITTSNYTAAASTTLGSNHAYTQGSAFPTGVFGATDFSGWYDQVTITGGTGTGTAHFSVQLNGVVDAGAFMGTAGYGLHTSSIHPTLLTSNTQAFNVLNTTPWALDSVAATEIVSYEVLVSPYNDPNQIIGLFGSPPDVGGGIPALNGIPALDGTYTLGNDEGMGFDPYVPDLILTPGSNQNVNTILIGTFNFTYGEAFYLIGSLGTMIVGDGLESFCTFGIGDTCTPTSKEGTGATTLDFANSAHLINIALPEGATASFASGNDYSVTNVPEPSSIALVGLGLMGMGLRNWRTRRRT